MNGKANFGASDYSGNDDDDDDDKDLFFEKATREIYIYMVRLISSRKSKRVLPCVGMANYSPH